MRGFYPRLNPVFSSCLPCPFGLSGGVALEFMAIYGTALLAICLLLGVILGNWLGILIGVDANVGGVGIAMLHFPRS